MTAVVVAWSEPNASYRAICQDDACRTPPLLNPWRTWITTQVRATSLANDHNRAKHGGGAK